MFRRFDRILENQVAQVKRANRLNGFTHKEIRKNDSVSVCYKQKDELK